MSKTSSSDVCLFVIKTLISYSSSVHFDALTKTKTVTTIIQKVFSLACQHSAGILKVLRPIFGNLGLGIEGCGFRLGIGLAASGLYFSDHGFNTV